MGHVLLGEGGVHESLSVFEEPIERTGGGVGSFGHVDDLDRLDPVFFDHGQGGVDETLAGRRVGLLGHGWMQFGGLLTAVRDSI